MVILSRHIRSKLGKNKCLLFISFFSLSFSCRHCGEYYWDLDVMEKHTQTYKRPKRHGPFLCDTCGKEFKNYHPLIAHVRQLHAGNERIVYECYMCTKTFSTKYLLKYHMGSHMATKKLEFPCDICHKVFARKHALRQHSMIHTNQYEYKCNVCGKAFRRNKELKVCSRLVANSSLCDAWNLNVANLKKNLEYLAFLLGAFSYSHRREAVCMHAL